MSAKDTALKVLRAVRAPITVRKIRAAVRTHGLPANLEAPLVTLATGNIPSDYRGRAARVESIRERIGQQQSDIEVIYSPKPQEDRTPTVDLRPETGRRMQFDLHRIAHQTSVDPRWGVFLMMCAQESEAETILELGSCAGISGAYLASARSCRRLVTVEGSAELSALAQESIAQVSDQGQVINALFDDALDDLLPSLGRVDLVWIDGHHERVATLHYLQRIAPHLHSGSVVIFDDISWSADMRRCWEEIVADYPFAHVVDLGKCGLGVWNQGKDVTPRSWTFLGRRRVGTPHGWTQ